MWLCREVGGVLAWLRLGSEWELQLPFLQPSDGHPPPPPPQLWLRMGKMLLGLRPLLSSGNDSLRRV